ncbi:GPP34 family phosphoprotein [Nonomuraea sp. B12E4]|uniref:GPP34 family phosphoprotein n=1 Tax=Nonomuraea sp. B12E4 TaxID=3153564 RepID=UPI00325DA47B
MRIAGKFLAHSDHDGRRLVNPMQLDPALAGALPAEHAVAGRVELSDKKPRVTDPSPLGHPELDATPARIAQSRPSRPDNTKPGTRRCPATLFRPTDRLRRRRGCPAAPACPP